uniref:Phorbol-ester/DAG-type domain-containing protein n=1 Tax=Photinus pyralis TaxID=7054 RepID=A0A1Y1KA50_PHOPY
MIMAPGVDGSANAVSSKPCKYCKILPKNGLKCVKCQSVIHPGCVKYLKSAKTINENQLICCESEQPASTLNDREFIDEDNTVIDINTYRTEITYLKEIVSIKDILIKNQQELITSLKAQLEMMTQSRLPVTENLGNRENKNRIMGSINISHLTTNKLSYSSITAKDNSAGDASNALTPLTHNIKDQEKGITNAPSSTAKMGPNTVGSEEVTHNKSPSHDRFTVVTHKKKKTAPTILGTRVECDITAVVSRRNVFISRLHPNTTVDQLTNYIQKQNISVLAVEKLETQSDTISAFKIVIPTTEAYNIYKPEIWPQYTIIRPYRQPRNFPAATQSQPLA